MKHQKILEKNKNGRRKKRRKHHKKTKQKQLSIFLQSSHVKFLITLWPLKRSECVNAGNTLLRRRLKSRIQSTWTYFVNGPLGFFGGGRRCAFGNLAFSAVHFCKHFGSWMEIEWEPNSRRQMQQTTVLGPLLDSLSLALGSFSGIQTNIKTY